MGENEQQKSLNTATVDKHSVLAEQCQMQRVQTPRRQRVASSDQRSMIYAIYSVQDGRPRTRRERRLAHAPTDPIAGATLQTESIVNVGSGHRTRQGAVDCFSLAPEFPSIGTNIIMPLIRGSHRASGTRPSRRYLGSQCTSFCPSTSVP